MDVHFFKLITGEEIMSKAKRTNTAWNMENPVKLAFTQQGLAMMPYLEPARSLCTGKSDKLTILHEHILFHDEVTNEEVFNGYNSKFGSGIVLAGTGGLRIAGD